MRMPEKASQTAQTVTTGNTDRRTYVTHLNGWCAILTEQSKMSRRAELRRKTNKATQTEQVDAETAECHLEIARLQEKVKLMAIEMKVLKDHKNNENMHPMWLQEFQPPSTPIKKRSPRNATPVVKGCGCRGNCSTLKCGCVKKESVCGEFCKCPNTKCMNKDPSHEEENKENVAVEVNKVMGNLTDLETETSTSSLGLQEESYSDVLTIPELDESFNFNPMIPKHELPRTPPISHGEKSLPQNLDTRLSQTPPLEPEKQSSIAYVISQADISWDKHMAELIQCKKCERKYFPNRIEKHEACCKNRRRKVRLK